MTTVIVRDETPADRAHVRRVNEAAFGAPQEADLVDALRAEDVATVSLVAEERGEIVGHILFSPVTLEGAGTRPLGLGLAPMAVIPSRQHQGIGSRLAQAGLDRCRALGACFVVVLGHPAYYPRFGFVPASRLGLRCEYDAPDEAFMAMELVEGALEGLAGLVRYHPTFGGVE